MGEYKAVILFLMERNQNSADRYIEQCFDALFVSLQARYSNIDHAVIACRSKSYKRPETGHVFLTNNYFYIAKFIKASGFPFATHKAEYLEGEINNKKIEFREG